MCVKAYRFPVFQGPPALGGCYLRRPGSKSRLSHGDIHLLRGLFCGFPLFFREHLRGFDHHHISGAGRQSHVRVQPREEWGAPLLTGAIASRNTIANLFWILGSPCFTFWESWLQHQLRFAWMKEPTKLDLCPRLSSCSLQIHVINFWL